MKERIFLSILPLILFIGCSIEDPETDPPEPKAEEPTPEEVKDTEPPSVPENLKVSEISFESLTLTWEESTDNEEVDYYEVNLNGSQVSEVESTTATVYGLTPATDYSLSVIAVDASGNSSAESESLETRTAEDTEPPSVPEQLSVSETTENSARLSWNHSSDNAGVKDYDILLNGEFLATTTSTEFSLEGLQSATSYSLQVQARDIYDNLSALSEAVEFTTESSSDPPPTTSEGILLISEYVEGSSYNKALEVVNLTGSEIDLSSYSLKKISNQNEDWSDERSLEGKLISREVYVIAHSRADPAIREQADLTLGGGIISFNGNDPIGLFKDGELIDMVGKAGGEDFAKDVTLRRKSSISEPDPNYSPDEWDSFGLDDFSGLGKW